MAECPGGYYWDEQQKRCKLELYDPSGGGYPDPRPPGDKQKGANPPYGDPGGDAFQMPCPPDQCKDVVSGVCRRYNPNREKVNMTDDIERESGGGRGYCRKTDGGGGGGRGGGGAFGGGDGGAGGGHGGFGPSGPDVGVDPAQQFKELQGVGGNYSKLISDFVSGVLEGDQTRYSPEVMQDLYAGSKAQVEGQTTQAIDALNSDLARRGIYRSPAGAGMAAEVRREGDRAFSEDARQFRIEKATKDFEDKLSAVDRAQADLNSMRSYIAQLDVTQAEREKLKATIQLGYARIDAEMAMLLKQLGSQKELLQLSLASQEKLANLSIGSNNWTTMMQLLYG